MPGSQCNQGRPSPNDRKELEDKSYRVLALWWVNNLEIPIRINELSKAATCSLTFIHWLFPLPCLLPHSANRLPGDHLPNKPVELKFVPRSVSGAWGGGGQSSPRWLVKEVILRSRPSGWVSEIGSFSNRSTLDVKGISSKSLSLLSTHMC